MNAPSAKAEEADGGQQRVKITVPRYYKAVSEGVWVDLESYLFHGFLTSPAFLMGKTFVFKTVNHLEVGNLSFLRPLRASPLEVRSTYQASFIAHSVLVVDGENVLHRRADHLGRLVKIFKKIPAGVQDEIVRNLSFLNERALRLHPLTEVYVHEPRSRFRWLCLRGSQVNSSSASGIPGTDSLGMNYVQQTWTALNHLLDQREDMESEWVNAKFIGSCFNGRGVRSVDERDKARREKDLQEREDKKMQVLYEYLNRRSGEGPGPAQVQLPDGRTAEVYGRFKADSVEDLAQQLSAALSGEKDHHDLVIERRMDQLRHARERMEADRMKMYRGSSLLPPVAPGSVPIHGPSRVLGGREEAEAQLRRMRSAQRDSLQERTKAPPSDVVDGQQGSDEPGDGRS